MTPLIPEPPGAGPRETPPGRAQRSRPQVGLRGMMLFTAAFAVWSTYWLNRQDNARLAARIPTMRPFAHELVAADETKAAVVKLEELWPDDDRWDVSLPPGRYRLCLSTRGKGYNGVPPAETSRPLAPGRHTIGLEVRKHKSGWRVEASCDGTTLLTADETPEWEPIKTVLMDLSTSTTLPADDLIVLQGGGFHEVQEGPASEPITFLSGAVGSLRGGEVIALDPGGPDEGIRLWIEPVARSGGRRPRPRFLRG